MTLGITKGSTVPKPNGIAFLDEYGEHVETLYETGSRPLTGIGGTANVVTATMAVDLTAAGFVDGLCVSITWAAANTAGVTLSINSGAAIPVLDAKGAALNAGTITAGLTSVLRYTSGSWRIISNFGAPTGGGEPTYQAFTANGTWVKPSGYDADTMVMVELWGGGGAGGGGAWGSGGGGGGAYNRRYFRIGDLPSTVSVTIGAGGVGTAGGLGSNGGNSTFGSLLSAFGGGGGGAGTINNGSINSGSGGGELAAGTQGGVNTIAATIGGALGGGDGFGTSPTPTSGRAKSIFGGGGGTAGGPAVVGISSAVYGGGGGGGWYNGLAATAGGQSAHGGSGGAGGSNAGAAPGGGGGGGISGAAGGAGARGECRVWIMGN